MSLKRIRVVNYHKSYAYAPCTEWAVINADEVVSAIPTESRLQEPVMNVSFKNGTVLTCVGDPVDLLPAPADAKEPK